jgi:hypothetical protein
MKIETFAQIAILVFIVCVFGSLSYQIKVESDVAKEAIKAGLVQKREGLKAPIWVKP